MWNEISFDSFSLSCDAKEEYSKAAFVCSGFSHSASGSLLIATLCSYVQEEETHEVSSNQAKK